MSRPVRDQFAESVAAMEAEFPGYFLESLHTGMGWGSHDPAGNYKANVGAWRSRFGIVSWIATVIQEGWEYESERHIGSGDTPTAAIEVVTLEFAADEGPDAVAQALLANLVLPGGKTMGEWADKQLPDAYRDGAMPPLLLGDGR